LVQNWWVESDFKAPNFPLSLRLKGSGGHYYRETTDYGKYRYILRYDLFGILSSM
jgi:hypothetical protein